MAEYPYSAQAFRERVLERFESRANIMAAVSGDGMLNEGFDAMVTKRDLRDAAVLIPVIDRGGEATVLLTLRTDHLPSHKGQIAFPGGKLEEGETPVQAALREAEEEVGLHADQVEVLGTFGNYLSGSGYRVFPVVAMVKGEVELTLCDEEVAEAFEVPLSFLMDQNSHKVESLTWKDKERFFYAMPYQDETSVPPQERRIWGLTAGIIRTVQERLYGA